MRMTHTKQQSGYALATALLLLVIMAGLGVSMFGNVSLQEKMSNNLSVKNRSMLVADSALQSNFTFEVLNDHLGKDKTVTVLDPEFSDQILGDKFEMKGLVSVCYLGYIPATGNSINSSESVGGQYTGNVNHVFVAAAYAEEEKTNSITTVEQGGYIEGQRPTDAFVSCDAFESGFDVAEDFTDGIITGDES